MHTYFFTSFLPTLQDLNKKYEDLVIKYPDINKYLYITSLHSILSGATDHQQKEFLLALESSENLAEKWIQTKPELTVMITEHLERNVLALHSKLL